MKKLIKKTKFNLHSSLRHGTVAIVMMILTIIFFGRENLMIAFPIALTSVVMGRQNLNVKTLSKYMTLLTIDIIIVVTAYIGGINIYLGIIINFIAIFLISYILISPYEITTYRPFIMLYVFTQFSRVPLSRLGIRLLCVVMGVTFVFIANMIKGTDEKNILGKSLRNAFINIGNYAEGMIEGNKDCKEIDECMNILNKLAHRVYISRHKNYFTTELGRIQFQLIVTTEKLAFTLCDIDYFEPSQWEAIKLLTSKFIEYGEGKISIEELNEEIDSSLTLKNTYEDSLITNFYSISRYLEALKKIGPKNINRIYSSWKRSRLDHPMVLFRENLHRKSLRFKFALRLAITLTITLFLGDMLGYYKIIWSMVTILSIMYHYYEDTVLRIKQRIVGNIMAIMFTGIVINITGSYIVTGLILVISVYLLYGFKEYHKISLFSATASLCIASITKDVNILVIYRLMYVLIGGGIVYLANKFIYPYHTKDGLRDMSSKILRYNVRLIDDVEQYEMGNDCEHEIRDLVIHILLLGEKLHVRNAQYGDEDIEEFIRNNNRFIIDLAYNTVL